MGAIVGDNGVALGQVGLTGFEIENLKKDQELMLHYGELNCRLVCKAIFISMAGRQGCKVRIKEIIKQDEGCTYRIGEILLPRFSELSCLLQEEFIEI